MGTEPGIMFTLAPIFIGVVAEGDQGMLTFQGTRYLSFNREIA
jgi:hypothetical protein